MKKALLLLLSIFMASCAFTPQIRMQAGGTAMEVNERVPLVLAVDYSPDGKTIAAGGWGGAVRLWDVAAGKEYAKFKGHEGDVRDVSFSHDGKTIASIGEDNTIRIWDVAAGNEINKLSDLKDRTSGVMYLPGDKFVVGVTNAANKETTTIFDVQSGRAAKNFVSSGRNFALLESKKARFSPDGKSVLTRDGFSISLKDVATGAEIWKRPTEELNCTPYFVPNGKQVCVLCQKFHGLGPKYSYFVLLDAATGRQIKEFGRTGGSVSLAAIWDQIGAIDFSPDGRFVLAGSLGGKYKLWDIAGGKVVRQLKIADELEGTLYNIIPAIAFSPDGKTVAVESIASTRLCDVATGNELAAMISFEDGEWIVITPDGYYNSSPNGHRYLNVKEGDKLYTVDQFYDVFYRPDIVAAKLRGEDIKNLVTVSMKDAIKSPPPAIEIAPIKNADSPKVKVCYQVKSTGGGIGEVRLFHNGKLIQSDGYYREVAKSATAGKMQLASRGSRAIYDDMRSVAVKGKIDAALSAIKTKGEIFDDCREVEAIPGENEVSVAAFNSGNTVQSYIKTISFNSGIKADDPHLYILSIGIDKYRDSSVNLKYAVKDSQDLEDKLKAQATTLYKPQNIHYSLLTNKEATKGKITGKIDELAHIIKPNDSFILFVAGHGVLLQNQYYMLTHDFNGQVSDANMISSNEIVETSKKIKSLSQLFIFDTCHAGGVDTIVSGLYDARMSVLAKKMGLHIYASASDRETAMDGYKGNGLFTYTLLEGLNNNRLADKNKDGKVSVAGLGGYTKERTVQLSREAGHLQTPLIINFGKDYPLYQLR